MREALYNAIKNGPHASACTLEMVWFIRGEMKRRVNDGFSILVPAAGKVRIFGERLKLFCIPVVPQGQRQPLFILNIMAQPDKGTHIINATTDI